jgi:hypothetical protein
MRVRNKNKERSDVKKRNHRSFKMRLVKQNLLVLKERRRTEAKIEKKTC